jgi:hypothetical protein
MATSADVPNIYDVVIGSTGYVFPNQIDENMPFRYQRARYGYTPTFIERSNTSGDYGDNQQDFWLTASMRDWSLGEDQKFFKTNDDQKVRQYWLGSNVNVSVPGQVTIQSAGVALTFAAACSGAGSNPAGAQTFTSSSTNLYEVASDGTITDRGAHGCGGLVKAFATDGVYLYLSGDNTTLVRRFDLSAHTFADFSSTPMDDLVFLNNTLYGCNDGTFYLMDTSGNALSAFVWKDATGTELVGKMKLCAFGGKVMILRNSGSTNGAELWQYDGVGVSKLAEYPANFSAEGLCIQSGIVFIIGAEGKVGEGFRTALWYYANGTIGRAWANSKYESNTLTNIGADVTPFGNGLIFTDFVTGFLRFYDLQIGGISSVAGFSASAGAWLATSNEFVLLTQGATSGTLLFSSTVASTGFVETSIADFESSLTKLFRGIIVDWVPGTDGDGGSVDISYQVDSVDGAYVSLKTGAASGTEYEFSGNVTGRGLSVKVTLNKGTSTLGPTLKRIYVRAAPMLTKFRQGEYVLDCTGRLGEVPPILRNGLPQANSGQEQLDQLISDITSGVPTTVSDRLGTYTAIVELDNSDIFEVRPNEYWVRLTAREV